MTQTCPLCIESEAWANLDRFENVRIYKGWIPENIIGFADKEFYFTHIDVGLYQSTYNSLDFLPMYVTRRYYYV